VPDDKEKELKDKIAESNIKNGNQPADNPWTTASGAEHVSGKSGRSSGNSSTLTGTEIARLEKEATIWAKIHFQVQQLFKKDEKGKTDIAEKDTPVGAAQQAVDPGSKEGVPKKKGWVLPLIGTLAAGITAFAVWLSEFLGPVGEFVTKTLPKLFKPMAKGIGAAFKAMKGGKLMKMLGGIAGKIGGKIMKFGRFIPVLGSLFSFGFGIARWKKGEYIPAIFEFLSGILNLLPFGVTNIASMIIDGALLLYDLDKESKAKNELDPTGQSFSMWDKIREYFLMSPGIQNIISLGKAIGAVFRGEWGEAGQHFMESLPVVGNILFWIREAKEGNPHAQLIVGKVSDFFSKVGEKIVSFFTGIISSIWEGIKALGDKMKRIGKAVWAATKALVPGGESPTEAFERVFYADDLKSGPPGRPGYGKRILLAKDKGAIMLNDEDTVVAGTDLFGKKPDATINIKLDKFLGKQQTVAVNVDSATNEIKISNMHLSNLVKKMDELIVATGLRPKPVQQVQQAPPQQNDDMSGDMSGATMTNVYADWLSAPQNMNTPAVTS